MKSSVYLLAASALLVSASPVDKRQNDETGVVGGEKNAGLDTLAVTMSGNAQPEVYSPGQFSSSDTPSPQAVQNTLNGAEKVKRSPKKASAADEKKHTKSLKEKAAKSKEKPAKSEEKPAKSEEKPAESSQEHGMTPEYQKAIVKKHNDERDSVNATHLRWSDILANLALVNGNGCVMEHDQERKLDAEAMRKEAEATLKSSQNETKEEGESAPAKTDFDDGFGQNLAWQSDGGVIDGGEAGVEQWIGEKPAHKESLTTPQDHYSQLVWKTTTHVGCVTIICGGATKTKRQSEGNGGSLSGPYTVCNYWPPGNSVGGGGGEGETKTPGSGSGGETKTPGSGSGGETKMPGSGSGGETKMPGGHKKPGGDMMSGDGSLQGFVNMLGGDTEIPKGISQTSGNLLQGTKGGFPPVQAMRPSFHGTLGDQAEVSSESPMTSMNQSPEAPADTLSVQVVDADKLPTVSVPSGEASQGSLNVALVDQ